jgi:hypothetical protein
LQRTKLNPTPLHPSGRDKNSFSSTLLSGMNVFAYLADAIVSTAYSISLTRRLRSANGPEDIARGSGLANRLTFTPLLEKITAHEAKTQPLKQ